MGKLRDAFEARVKKAFPDVQVNGEKARRVPNTSYIRFPGVQAELLLTALDLDGVYVSAGSACSSGSITPSPVLLAIGLSAENARECLRFSFGFPVVAEDIDAVADAVIKHVGRIRERRKKSLKSKSETRPLDTGLAS